MTSKVLNALTRKQLATRAKQKGIAGWHGMRKQELVEALLDVGKHRNGHAGSRNGRASFDRADTSRRQRDALRHIAIEVEPGTTARDHLVPEVLDSHWVMLTWSLTRRMVDRAERSLATDWHASVPVIRVIDVTAEGAGAEQTEWVKDVEIAGGADKWFVPIEDAARTYRLHIGFRAPSGEFFSLAHTRKVTLPRPDASSRLERPGRETRRSHQVPIPHATNGRRTPFVVEAELVVHGSADPRAHVSLLGEPIELDKDGFFSVRVSLPEGRQVIPAVAVTPGGDEQRTIVIAVERNTKVLEPESLVDR